MNLPWHDCNPFRSDLLFVTSSGSLSSRVSFHKVAADKARSIILLANKDDP